MSRSFFRVINALYLNFLIYFTRFSFFCLATVYTAVYSAVLPICVIFCRVTNDTNKNGHGVMAGKLRTARRSRVLLSNIFRCWGTLRAALRDAKQRGKQAPIVRKPPAGYILSARTRISLSENKRRKRYVRFLLRPSGMKP